MPVKHGTVYEPKKEILRDITNLKYYKNKNLQRSTTNN